jgi:hypothetical protein
VLLVLGCPIHASSVMFCSWTGSCPRDRYLVLSGCGGMATLSPGCILVMRLSFVFQGSPCAPTNSTLRPAQIVWCVLTCAAVCIVPFRWPWPACDVQIALRWHTPHSMCLHVGSARQVTAQLQHLPLSIDTRCASLGLVAHFPFLAP